MTKYQQTKLNEDVHERIVKAIKLGATRELAAKYGGITRKTLYTWIKKGEAARSGKYKELVDGIRQAEGERAARWLALINQVAQDRQWQAAAWLLERTSPESYGRQQLNIKSDNTMTIKVERSDD